MNTVTLHLWLKITDFTLIKSFWPQDQNTLGKKQELQNVSRNHWQASKTLLNESNFVSA